VSKHFIATFKTSGFQALTLIAAHLKSGGADTDCQQREAQATILRELYKSGDTVIVLGDFNDWNPAFVDAQSVRGSSKTIPVLAGSDLRDVGEMLAQSDRLTNSIGMIDHILGNG
jgi:endonuclease/exonuclease/phosphatase family metal-dependent hydrolase